MFRALAITIGLFLVPSGALACTCSNTSLEQHFLESDLVFEGRVVSSRVASDGAIVVGAGSYTLSGAEKTLATIFDVTRPLKGREQSQRTILHSPSVGGNCGISFDEKVTYQVFAYRSGDEYLTSMCTATTELRDKTNQDNDSSLPPTISERRDEAREVLFNDDESPEDREEALHNYSYTEYLRRRISRFEDFLDTYSNTVRELTKEKPGPTFQYILQELELWQDHENIAESHLNAARFRPGAPSHLIAAADAFIKALQYEKALDLYDQALAITEDGHAEAGRAKALLMAEGNLTANKTDYRDLEASALDLSDQRGGTVDLSNGRFETLDLSGAHIQRLQLNAVVAGTVDLTNATLRGASLGLVRFGNEAKLAGTVLREGSLLGADMAEADFSGADLRNVDARSLRAWDGIFVGARLGGADFREAYLNDANFSDADFGRGTRFENADLGSSNLTGANLSGVALDGADLAGAHIDCKTRLPDDIDPRTAGLIPEEPVCGREPQNRDFGNQDWSFDSFEELDLQNANFRGAEFYSTNFHNSVLRGADFRDTTGNAFFPGADLSDANFTDVEMTASFYGFSKDDQTPAKLDNTDFSHATLSTEAFLGRLVADGRSDLSSTIFDHTKFSCDRRSHLSIIKEFESGDDRVYSTRADPEMIKRLRQRDKDYYAYAKKWITAEAALIEEIAAAWPSAEFDEECQAYLVED